MPGDATFGRDLAKRLTAKYGGRIKEVEFTYDAFLEIDRLEENRPYCKISPQTYDDVRETRSHWRETAQLVLTLVSAVGPTDDPQWIDDWLDSWDLIIRELREIKVLGKHKPMSISRPERYDVDMFHNNRRLKTQAIIDYQHITLR